MRSGAADTNHLERADLFGLSSEGQHHHMAGLNLLASIVIYSNTAHLGEEVRQRKHAGLTVEPELLARISPLGWAHILLTGELPVAKARVATLAYDSTPYRNRPAVAVNQCGGPIPPVGRQDSPELALADPQKFGHLPWAVGIP